VHSSAVSCAPTAAPRAAVAHPIHQLTQRGPSRRTGGEQFTNTAEYLSLTSGRRWHLSSSLRFSLHPPHHAGRRMQEVAATLSGLMQPGDGTQVRLSAGDLFTTTYADSFTTMWEGATPCVW
jgi:hypothetical protein